MQPLKQLLGFLPYRIDTPLHLTSYGSCHPPEPVAIPPARASEPSALPAPVPTTTADHEGSVLKSGRK